MTQISICNNKFQVSDPKLVDPRAQSPVEYLNPEDLTSAIQQSFENPVDFPPIPQAIMQEDTIAIAVEPDTPCGLQVARLVSRQFHALGTQPENIVIVCAEHEPGVSNDISMHDSTDSEALAYLCADAEGLPVYVNRLLFDADIVVPVGTGDGGRSINSICPSFCDLETRDRMQKMGPQVASGMTRMVDSNLGVFWQIRLVTAPGEEVVQVMVGATEQVLQKSGELGHQLWNLKVENEADMVLATIESSSCQSWSNLRAAILASDQITASKGSIVVCTELNGKPPSTWPTPDNNSKKKDKELDEVFQRRHVYLASRMSQATTEKIGFGHVEESEQLQRLINQHSSCLLLRDAHRVGFQAIETV